MYTGSGQQDSTLGSVRARTGREDNETQMVAAGRLDTIYLLWESPSGMSRVRSREVSQQYKQAQSYLLEDGRKVDNSVEDLSRRAASMAIVFTVLLPWAPQHQKEVLQVGGDYLLKFGEQAKTEKHAPAEESTGATFLIRQHSRFSARGGQPSP